MLLAQLSITAHAPDSVGACEPIEVSVAVQTTGTIAPQVLPPAFGPFEVLRSTVMPRLIGSPATGGMVTAEYEYVLASERTGEFTLPPFEARLDGEVARTRPLRIVVTQNYAARQLPTIVARARVDTSLDINFRALTSPETVYVGQQANYEVAVFLNESVRSRLRRNPTFYPPDMQSMLAYDVPQPLGEPPRRRVGERCFDALVYQRALFPLLAGRFTIPPAALRYDLALSAGYYSQEESSELQTDSTFLVAVEPPLANRPSDYAGAVGDLRVAAKLDTTAARVGDPLLLTVSVAGTGNVKLFPRPAVQISWATLVPAEERVNVDSTARRVRGVKEFDWVLTPKIAGDLDLAPVRYSYFNPDLRRYLVAATASTRVHVATGGLAVLDTAARRPVLPLRAMYAGPVGRPVQQEPLFWAMLVAAPLPALTIRWRSRRRRAARPRPALATLRALARGAEGATDPCRVRRVFISALAERVCIEPEHCTRPGALSHALRRRGVSSTVAGSAERLVRALDESAFSGAGVVAGEAASSALDLYRAVDREALTRGEIALRPALALVLTLGIGIALHASVPTDARTTFVHGVSEYYGGRYLSARDAFARSASAEPRSADAWANLGTAAWAAGDTARAVVGWQRALLLQPLSADVRDRLDAVRPARFASAGYVLPVPMEALVWLIAVLWVAAWTFGAVHLVGHNRGTRVAALSLGVASLLLALAALDVGARQDVRQLAVVRVDTPLSTVPALGGERVGSVGVGEVARITGRQGVWLRVSLDGGREGWLDEMQVIPLDGNSSPSD